MRNEVNRAFAAKTTLRYLLIAFAVMVVMSVNAQNLAQQPTTEFHSTSSMVGSGSTLPQAVQAGAFTTYDVGYNASHANKPSIRRVGEDDGFENEDEPDKPANPFPIGDGLWALMFLACAFALFRYVRTRKSAECE